MAGNIVPRAQYAMMCNNWGSGGTVSLPVGPRKGLYGGPEGKAPGSSRDPVFYHN